MDRGSFQKHTTLARTGLKVSRIGLASGYSAPARGVIRAFEEYGINYFYWDRRKPGMRDALRELARKRRDDIVIAVQSYDHTGLMLRRSVEKALKQLEIERADILFLGWFNKMPSQRVLDVTSRLREEGKFRFLGVTGHNRAFHGEAARQGDQPFDVHQVRYNAAHRGAESDVFAGLPDSRPGIVTYTATRWGKLLKANKMPPGERPLTAAECYRFVLSHPAVDVCLAGPRTEQEMEEGLQAIAEGPLSEDELHRVRAIGDHVHG
ncbi:MAG: aldo/keto reductase [Deltaproteobacteria bacterium]|nr:aldo/keto reductase [Deltaproteobacteria bacterium]